MRKWRKMTAEVAYMKLDLEQDISCSCKEVAVSATFS